MKVPKVYASEEVAGPQYGSLFWNCGQCGKKTWTRVGLDVVGIEVECVECGTREHLGIKWVDKDE